MFWLFVFMKAYVLGIQTSYRLLHKTQTFLSNDLATQFLPSNHQNRNCHILLFSKINFNVKEQLFRSDDIFSVINMKKQVRKHAFSNFSEICKFTKISQWEEITVFKLMPNSYYFSDFAYFSCEMKYFLPEKMK